MTDTDIALDPAIHARRWAILAVLCTSLMIVIIGNTALNVAIPRLAEDLGATTTDLQWMVDSYALVFAGMLFTAGTIGDRFGRKGTLQAGLLLFMAGTVVAAVGHSSSQVIAGRALMGLAAAFVMPSTLSILTNVFPAVERPKAIGVWAGIAGGGAAIGPIASGFLLEHFWWGSVFLVNLPVIVVALVAGKVLLPTSRDPEQPPLDIPGALLSIVGLGSLVYGIIEGPSHGWLSGESLLIFGGSVAVLGLFAWRELTARHPMLDLRLFRDRRFSVASGGMTLVFFAMFGSFFLVSQYFQLVLGYSPLASGLFQLPMAALMMVTAPLAPGLVARHGAARVVPVGLASVATGLVLFSMMGTDTTIWFMYGPLLFLGGGMAITMTPLTTLIMSTVSLGKAGVGSAMNDTTRELGGALGVAVLGSLLTSAYTSSMDGAVAGLGGADRAIAETGMVGAFQVADRIGPSGTALIAAAKDAFMDGVHLATLTGAGVVVIAAIAAFKLLPRDLSPEVELAEELDPVEDGLDGLDELLDEVVPVPG